MEGLGTGEQSEYLSENLTPGLWPFFLLLASRSSQRHWKYITQGIFFWRPRNVRFYFNFLNKYVCAQRQKLRETRLVPKFNESLCFVIYSRSCGLPRGTVVKKLPANAGDGWVAGLIPGSGRSPWRRRWRSTPVFLPGEPRGQGRLAGYSLWGHKGVRHNWVYTHSHTHTHTLTLSFSLSET